MTDLGKSGFCRPSLTLRSTGLAYGKPVSWAVRLYDYLSAIAWKVYPWYNLDKHRRFSYVNQKTDQSGQHTSGHT